MHRLSLIFSVLFLYTCGGGGGKKATGPVVPTQPPTVNNLTLTTNEDTPTTFTMTGTDPGGFALTFSIATDPQHGTLTTSGAAGTYTPNANYNGTDIFGYIATNGTLASVAGVATITIVPQDDNPNTMNVSAVTDEDNAVEITLEAEEYDGDTISFNIKDNPTSGSVTISGDKATYTPNANYYGADSFTFEAVDTSAKKILNTATASLTINPINDAPTIDDMSEQEGIEDTDLTITLTGNDIEGDNLSFEVETAPTQGSITNNGTSFTYSPNQDFYGADSLTYVAYDGTEYSEEAKKIPLFIDRGSRDWPFLYDYQWNDGLMGDQPASWEGYMADYDNDGAPDLSGSTYGLINFYDYTGNNWLNLSLPTNQFPNVPVEDLNAGFHGFGHVNNDGFIDFWFNPMREFFTNWPNGQSLEPGPLFIGLTNGSMDDVTWVLIDDDIIFWNSNALNFTDFDGDGDVDLVGQEAFDDRFFFYDNQGDNTFVKTNVPLPERVSLGNFYIFDINKDGIRDFVSIGEHETQNNSFTVLYGTSQYDQFTIYESTFSKGATNDLTIVDLDGDGEYEIIALCERNDLGQANDYSEITVLKSQGGVYMPDTNQADINGHVFRHPPGYVNRTTAWDFDGDGDKDIFGQIAFDVNNPPEEGMLTCAGFAVDWDKINNGEWNQGYFWKNNDGVLVKTYYSTKEGECYFDYPEYWGNGQ